MLIRVLPDIPSETARVARSIFSERNLYLLIGNSLCPLTASFGDATDCSEESLSIQSPNLLALITLFQFIEALTDRKAAEALRHRLDWKYALHLPVNFPGVPYLQVCEFRQSLLSNPESMACLQSVIERMKNTGIIGAQSRVQTGELQNSSMLLSVSADQIVRTICTINQLNRLVDTIARVMQYFAAYHTAWLRTQIKSHWYQRYSPDSAIRELPASPADWPAHLEAVGNDGTFLLESIQSSQILGAGPAGLAGALVALDLQSELNKLFKKKGSQPCYRSPPCRECRLNSLSG